MCSLETISLIPRPSHRPVFDCLQYEKEEGEGLSTQVDRGGRGLRLKERA